MNFNPDDLLKIKTAVVHDSCADGLASALLLKSCIPNVNIQFVQHGTEEFRNIKASEGMIFADIAPPESRAQEFIDAGALILDHHKGSKALLDRFGDKARFGDEDTQPGVSGAVLVEKYIYSQLLGDREEFWQFAQLAGVADTWQRQSVLWKDAIIQLNTLNFYNRDYLLDQNFERLITLGEWKKMLKVGEMHYANYISKVRRSIKGGYTFNTSKGTRVIAFEGLSKTSEAAEILGNNVDLVVGWSLFCENNVPKIVFSARSHTDFNCMEFAKSNGGGGHTKAAGFSVSLGTRAWESSPIRRIIYLLECYESPKSFFGRYD